MISLRVWLSLSRSIGKNVFRDLRLCYGLSKAFGVANAFWGDFRVASMTLSMSTL